MDAEVIAIVACMFFGLLIVALVGFMTTRSNRITRIEKDLDELKKKETEVRGELIRIEANISHLSDTVVRNFTEYREGRERFWREMRADIQLLIRAELQEAKK